MSWPGVATWPPSAGVNVGAAIWADASDGSVTFDGVTTILGMIPAGNVYTLTRDFFFNNVTINPGVTVIGAFCRFFATGAFTNNGTYHVNGNNAAGAAGGAANTNAAGTMTTLGGVAGTSGGTGAGGAGSNAIQTHGGAGGAGGASGANAGGVGGTAAAPSAFMQNIHSMPWALIGWLGTGTPSLQQLRGSPSGGAGGGDGANNGGGGGGGGGIGMVCAKIIQGTGTISCRGGNGGNGVAGNAAGGGGGGGGLLVIISTSVVNGLVPGQTLSVAGGAPGNGVGTGANGVAGTAGTLIAIAN